MLNRPWFNQSALVRSVMIGEGVTSIGDCAFYAFSNLESVVIPDTVTSIGDHAFDACLHFVQQTAADFDKNGYVDSADSLALLKHVLQIQ